MKKIFFILLMLFSFINVAHAQINLRDSQGATIASNDLKNKWVIINYWAAWCDSCIEEVPQLNEFYKNNTRKDVVMYGVNYDHLQSKNLQAAIHQLGINFPVMQDDPSDLWKLGSLDVLPMTFIIDPNGKVAKKIVGGNTAQSLMTILDNLKNKNAATA